MRTKVLVPSIRNLKILPPVINLVNCIAEEHADVTLISYKIDNESYSEKVEKISFSKVEYPKPFIKRLYAKSKSYLLFYSYLFLNIKRFDIIWIGVWDYPFINRLARVFGFKGKIVYQFHELEVEKFKYCRKADYCIVPEENRLWITYFEAGLSKIPFLLPNVPYLNFNISADVPAELKILKNSGKKIILYQGLIDFKKRCLSELVNAFTLLPDNFCLVIMPMPNTGVAILKLLNEKIIALGLLEKVIIINSRTPPFHLEYIKHADLGIGLYRATSLNQIYAAPNRLYEFTKFSVPVILPNFPAFKALSYKYKYGINVVDPESDSEIAAVIKTVLSNLNNDIAIDNAGRFFSEFGNYEKYVSNIWEKITNKI